MDHSLKPHERLLNHQGCFKKTWDIAGVLLSLYSSFVIPFFVAFYTNRPVAFTVTDLAVDVFFTADLALSFFSTREDPKGHDLSSSSQVRWAYLKSSFPVDLVSTFPLDKVLSLFYPVTHGSVVTVEMMKVLRIRRLSLISRDRLKLGNRIIQLLIYLGILLHVTGCAWFVIVRQEETWMPYQDLEKHGTGLYSSGLWSRYLTILYQGIWLVFGQEIAPRSLLEIWAACFSLTIGMVITSYLFGEMLMIVSRLGLKYKIRQKALNFCLDVTGQVNLPKDLKTSILEYTDYVYPTLTSQEEFDRLFKYLSPSLKGSILRRIYQPILTSNEIFEDDEQLCEFFLSRVKYQFYLPEEEIITEGTKASDFFILAQGVCTVFVKTRNGKKTHLGFLNEGKHFGEIGMVYKTYRTASVISHVYSTVARMGKEEFRTLTTAFPYVLDKLKELILAYDDPWKTFVVNSLIQSTTIDSLPRQVVEELVYKMKIVKVQAGGFLFKNGEVISGAYLIAWGNFQLSLSLKEKILSDYNVQISQPDEESSPEAIQLTLINEKSRKVRAEAIPILSEESATPDSANLILHIGILGQGTLIYSQTGLKRGLLHRLDCKALENSSVYCLDSEIIRSLSKEHESFRRMVEKVEVPDYFDLLNPESIQSNVRFRFNSSVAKVILIRREQKRAHEEKFKGMVETIRAVLACQHAGNTQLAEQVMKGKVLPAYITSEGHLDPAFMYSGSLPCGHPVLRSFELVTSSDHKSSLTKQANSLRSELKSLLIKAGQTRHHVNNSVELMQTLKSQVFN
jgi:CRP-like cAMP-binding protein